MTKHNFTISRSAAEKIFSQEGKNIIGLFLQYQEENGKARLFVAGESSGGQFDLHENIIILNPLGETDGGSKP